MKRLAIFVEGQCEQLFVEKLLREIAKIKQISIIKKKADGGSRKRARNFIEISARSSEELSKNPQYFILIVDCGGEAKVKSDILDEYESLSNAGYEKIIGIRDVSPKVSYNEISRLRNGLAEKLPAGKVAISFILSVMEFEAWLVAEHTHFSRINPKITFERIKEELGIDVINDDLSRREKPATDLSNIYWLEKIEYDKSFTTINHILSKIDFHCIRNNVSLKFSDLQVLYQELDSFFQAGT